MLSFIREKEHEEPSGHGRPQTQESALDTQQEYLTVSARDKKNVRRSTMLLGGLFVLGLMLLLFMIRQSSPRTATASPGQTSAEDAQVEAAIAQLTGGRAELFCTIGEVGKKFYQFSDVQQVKVDELAKNPFRRDLSLGDLKEKSDTQKENFGVNSEITRQEQLRQQAKNMQLLSIVSTDAGRFCVIDDKRLYEGDSIKGFKVSKIGDNTVLLESEGVEVVLKLTE